MRLRAGRGEPGGVHMGDRKVLGGLSTGGIIVIVGLLVMFALGWFWIGLIIALIGLVAFGGFAKGKWY